jgi:acyl-CoA thioesterase
MSDIIERLKSQARNEPVAAFLGLELIELSPGYAKVSMKMKPEYVNFNGIVFGPIISAVADQAFAYAGNSVFTPNVASQFNIHYLASATAHDELFGECTVLKKGKRVCIMEMKVTNQEGKLIAIASGTTIPLV